MKYSLSLILLICFCIKSNVMGIQIKNKLSSGTQSMNRKLILKNEEKSHLRKLNPDTSFEHIKYMDKNQFLEKLNENKFFAHDLHYVEPLLLENNFEAFLTYLEKQTDHAKYQLIASLKRHQIREHIKQFFNLMLQMKDASFFKIRLLVTLQEANNRFIISQSEKILELLKDKTLVRQFKNILECMNKADPNFIEKNQQKIFQSLSVIPAENQYEVIVFIGKYKPIEFQDNIEEIINIVIKMNDIKYQNFMLNFIKQNIKTNIIITNKKILYKHINELEDSTFKKEMTEFLKEKADFSNDQLIVPPKDQQIEKDVQEGGYLQWIQNSLRKIMNKLHSIFIK